jgi:hypothetical protein
MKTPRESSDDAATGRSDAEAARPVRFEPNRGAGPSDRPDHGGGRDVEEEALQRRLEERGDKIEGETPSGAIPSQDLTTENDDGVS